jgi:hypothetical protein
MYRLCAVIALLCIAPPLAATVIVPAEFREVVAGSQLIVYGRVADVRPEWTADRRRIDSIVTFEASAYLKGGPGERVTFRVPGGQIGRYRSVTIGAPEFRPGEEAILFLTARGPSVAQVFGLNQGVFRIRVDERTGRRTVVSPALVGTGDAAERVKRGAPERRPVALDAFTGQVRAALEQAGGAR